MLGHLQLAMSRRIGTTQRISSLELAHLYEEGTKKNMSHIAGPSDKTAEFSASNHANQCW